jgi:hypothetical protein
MKARMPLAFLILAAAVFVVGCDDDSSDSIVNPYPQPPQGVYSVTADGAVELYWTGPYRNDIVEFIIYRSFEATTGYEEIGRRTAVPNPDLDLIYYEPGYVDNTAINGVTYWYAIASVDRYGRVSLLSAENVFDTPRKEGTVKLYDADAQPTWAGFSLENAEVVPWNHASADVFVWVDGGIFWLMASRDGTDMQDMGYTYSFAEIGYAPDNGWVQVRQLELIEGHTYVIWTEDYHYAKLRVTNIGATSVDFQWAYQTDTDNRELSPGLPGEDDPEISEAIDPDQHGVREGR